MKTFSYIVGISLVGLGIVTLIFAAIGGISAISANEVLMGCICGGVSLLFAIGFLVFGMKLVRYGESDLPRNEEYPPEYSDANEFQSSNPIQDLRTNFGSFDLSRINLAGWFLFLASIGFIGLEIVLLVVVFQVNFEKGGSKAIIAVAFFLGLGFFGVGKAMLNAMGISIYRDH